MKLKLYLIFIFLLSTSVHSTTFIPLSLDKQMEDASGVLRAKFLGLEYRKISNNRIITEATFKIIKSVGVKQSEIINKNNFKVIYPGGKWQDLDYRVTGAPRFEIGEEATLILKKTSLGYSVKGLGMGKYTTYKKDEKTFYKSSVFPDHPRLGNISKEYFDNALVRRFDSTMKEVKSDKYVSALSSEQRETTSSYGRSPASRTRVPSSERLDNHGDNESGSPFWMVVIFSLLGALSAFSIKRSKRIK